MRVTLTILGMILAGCGSESTNPGWTLQGTVAGYSLQNEAISAEAHEIEDSGATITVVNLVNQPGACELVRQNGIANAHLLALRAGGNAETSYPMTGENATKNQAVMLFMVFDAEKNPTTQVASTSGTLTITENRLAAGGPLSLHFDAMTPEGPVSGSLTAPNCVL